MLAFLAAPEHRDFQVARKLKVLALTTSGLEFAPNQAIILG
jgi:hypothetical protein